MARLRFCPSPAGKLHVGHVRNAVFTWILARQVGGDYFVRFENTDRAKEVPGASQAIVEDLEWLGLLGTEPPHDQANMTDSYRAALERLASAGHTYRDGNAVRFRTPTGGTLTWDDLVRGQVSVRNDDLDDPVLVRSSGEPTFYLASTVDDMDDGITHVLRPDVTLRITATQFSPLAGPWHRAAPSRAHPPGRRSRRQAGPDVDGRSNRPRPATSGRHPHRVAPVLGHAGDRQLEGATPIPR
jgi:glutamyl-tRNA synthetase